MAVLPSPMCTLHALPQVAPTAAAAAACSGSARLAAAGRRRLLHKRCHCTAQDMDSRVRAKSAACTHISRCADFRCISMHTMTIELQAQLTAAAAVHVWPNGECVLKRSPAPNPSLTGCDRANVCAITAPAALGVF